MGTKPVCVGDHIQAHKPMTVLESIGLNQSRVLAFVERYNMQAPETPVAVEKARDPNHVPVPRKLARGTVSSRIREILFLRDMSVDEAAEALNIARSDAGKHLAILRNRNEARVVSPAILGNKGRAAIWGRVEATR